VLLDDSSDEEQLDSQEGDEGVEEEEEGSDQQQEGSSSPDAAGTDEGDDQPPNLNAFRFNGRSSTAKAAAAGGAGSKRDRQHGSSGSMSGSEEPDAADLAGVLQAEEALRGDVLEPSEFAPLELAKLPRGDDVERCIAARFGEDDSISVLVKLAGEA
jgi:hypothetical protein